ncbi:MAG TPA: protein kinase, partial [Polyangia bacterium]|nr:protein kinase [Polyangia bacterium]
MSPPPAAQGCLDENAVLAFLEGRLSPVKLAAADAHLSGCEACRELIAESAGVALSVTEAGENPATTRASPWLARGATIGRYVVLDLVGHGAMGEVYAAFDPQLNRKIALKLLKAGAAGADTATASRRMLREAKAIARLSHPNIVVVHDAGTIDERVFIAMEFVEGQTVSEWLRTARRDRREILDVFRAAGRGLVAAHAAGLVHRDFKPQNVMVASDGAVRVMDFGLASESDDAAAVDGTAMVDAPALDGTVGAAMTRTGTLLGTPAYMAPEQFLTQPADARSDQFSFCVALYEALYGERPFEGETVLELARRVGEGRVRDAPARSGVPSRLRRILLRGLRRARDERFPSMEALLAELARDPEKERRRVMAAVAGAAALLVVGAVVARTVQRPGALCRGV